MKSNSKTTRAEVIKKSPASRRALVKSLLRIHLPNQIRILREQRGLTQTDLAAQMEKKPTNAAISRMETIGNDKYTLRTLLELAEALDVGLLVKFVPHERLLREYADVSPESFEIAQFGKFGAKETHAVRNRQKSKGKVQSASKTTKAGRR